MKLSKIYFVLLISLASINSWAATFSGTVSISSTNPQTIAISGEIDVTGGTIMMDPVQYQGYMLSLVSGELLEPGFYYRTTTNPNNTFTRYGQIEAGYTGAYLEFSWQGVAFGVFMQWDVTNLGVTYTSVDYRGNTIVYGPLKFEKLNMDFTVNGPDPFINVEATVQGGQEFECTDVNGASVTMFITSVMNATGTIAGIDWVYNGLSIGSGESLTYHFPVGSHTVDVTAVTNEGASASDSVTFSVVDTTAPSLTIQFLNASGVPVTTALDGNFEISFLTSDACDGNPVITSASATPVMQIVNGDIIQVFQINGSVTLPTSAVRVSATVSDNSGNLRNATETLTIQ